MRCAWFSVSLLSCLMVPVCGLTLDAQPVLAQSAPVNAGDLLQQAMVAADQIADDGAKARALSAIGTARARAGDIIGAKESFQAARQSADKVTDAEASMDVLREIATALALARDTNGAKQIFDVVKEKAAKITEDDGKVVALAETAAAQAKAGLASEARQTFVMATQMAKDIVKPIPRTVALSEISLNEAASGNQVEALALAQEAQTVSSEIWGGDPNNGRYWEGRIRGLEVVSALAHAGDTGAATALANDIKDDYFKSRGLWGVASALSEAKNTPAALQIAMQVNEPFFRSLSLSEVGSAQANIGDFVGALQTIERIPDPEVKGNAMKALAIAQAKHGDIAAAQQIIGQLKNGSTEVLSEIALAQANAGDMATAQATAQGITDLFQKAITLAHLAEGVVQPQELLGAGEIMLEGIIQTIDLKTGSLTLLASSFSIPGKAARAISPAKAKMVIFKVGSPGSASLRAGTRIQVVGSDAGSGKALPVRVIKPLPAGG